MNAVTNWCFRIEREIDLNVLQAHFSTYLGCMFFLYNLDGTCICWVPRILRVCIRADMRL